MPQLIVVLLVISAAVYLLGFVLTSVIVSSIATIGSIIIIAIGSYFLRKSIINKALSERSDFLGGVNYSTAGINKQKEKINLYAFFAVIYSLFIMFEGQSYYIIFEGQSYYIAFISDLKYKLGIYSNLNSDTFNRDMLLFGGLVVCAITIYFFTAFIKEKFTNWVVDGIEKVAKKKPPITPKPKPRPTTRTKPKSRLKVDASQYGVTHSMSKTEIDKILMSKLVEWHHAENSPNQKRREEARKHAKNLSILRKELL